MYTLRPIVSFKLTTGQQKRNSDAKPVLIERQTIAGLRDLARRFQCVCKIP